MTVFWHVFFFANLHVCEVCLFIFHPLLSVWYHIIFLLRRDEWIRGSCWLFWVTVRSKTFTCNDWAKQWKRWWLQNENQAGYFPYAPTLTLWARTWRNYALRNVYYSTQRSVPEDSNVQQHRCEKLRSRSFKFPSLLACCLAKPQKYMPYQAARLSSLHFLHNVSQGILSPTPCNCCITSVFDNTSSTNLKVQGLGHFLSVRQPIFNGSQPKSIVTHQRSLCIPALSNRRT